MRRAIPVIAAITIVAATTPATAAEFGGGAILHIEDGAPNTCVNASQSLVSMQLASVQVDRHQTWWKELLAKKKALGVKFDITLTGADDQLFTFPRAKQLKAPPGGGDVATLPMGVSLMSRYRLNDGAGKEYKNVGLDLYFITVEDKSDALTVFNSLADFTKSLPIPANPFTTGIGYFGDFTNKLVDGSLRKGAGPDPDAAFTFDLASTAQQTTLCPFGYLREGVQAVVYDVSFPPDTSVIKISEVDKYCYWFDPNLRQVRFAPKSGACATAMPAAARQLNNPLVAFVVSAVPVQQGAVLPSQLTRVPGTNKSMSNLTAAQIERMISGMNAEHLSGRISASSVERILDVMELPSVPSEELRTVAEHATNQDLAAARALQRCAAAGIPVEECL